VATARSPRELQLSHGALRRLFFKDQLHPPTGGITVQSKWHFLPGSHFQAIGLLLLGK
jgi:hypothetical protein